MFYTTVAHAMGLPGGSGGDASGGLVGLLPIVAMFAIFYFLLIRPQQKRSKDHKAMIEALKRGAVNRTPMFRYPQGRRQACIDDSSACDGVRLG